MTKQIVLESMFYEYYLGHISSRDMAKKYNIKLEKFRRLWHDFKIRKNITQEWRNNRIGL